MGVAQSLDSVLPGAGRTLMGVGMSASPATWKLTQTRVQHGRNRLNGRAAANGQLMSSSVLGLSAGGDRPLDLGNLKPDYADLAAAIGGQVGVARPGWGA